MIWITSSSKDAMRRASKLGTILRSSRNTSNSFRSLCHARDNQSHPRPKISPSRLVPLPSRLYRSPRSLARHHYAPPTSYSISSRPHNPTQNTSRPRPNDYSRTRPTSLSALLAQARAAALTFRRTRYHHFAIFSPFPLMYTIVLVLGLPLSRSCCTLIFTFYV